MIRRSLALAGALGLGLLSLATVTSSAVASTSDPVYWCSYGCVDGTEGGHGPVSGGAECTTYGEQQCAKHGGLRWTQLDFYTPPAPDPTGASSTAQPSNLANGR